MPPTQDKSTPSRKVLSKDNQSQNMTLDKQAIQKSRKNILTEYSDRLSKIDNKVLEFVQKVVRETTIAYRTTLYFYTFSSVISAVILGVGLYLIFVPSQANNLLFALICIIGGIISLIYLQNRNPMKNVSHLVNNLVRINIIFAGYERQIHQVDAIFEDIFSTEGKVEPKILEDMLSHLQDAMAEAMVAISRVSNDFEE
jgi:ABC-type multidrug transport system fused ATPase/permease subunit